MSRAPSDSEIENSPFVPHGTYVIVNPQYADYLAKLSAGSDHPDQYPIPGHIYLTSRETLTDNQSKVLRLTELPRYLFYSAYFLAIVEADD